MELEPGIDHRDQSSGTKTLMPTEGYLPDPRLRLNRGQWALAVVALLMIIALVATNWAASATQRRYTETFARTESVGNNLSYTMREALSYIDESERYLLGFASRRDVQMVRAMLTDDCRWWTSRESRSVTPSRRSFARASPRWMMP